MLAGRVCIFLGRRRKMNTSFFWVVASPLLRVHLTCTCALVSGTRPRASRLHLLATPVSVSTPHASHGRPRTCSPPSRVNRLACKLWQACRQQESCRVSPPCSSKCQRIPQVGACRACRWRWGAPGWLEGRRWPTCKECKACQASWSRRRPSPTTPSTMVCSTSTVIYSALLC